MSMTEQVIAQVILRPVAKEPITAEKIARYRARNEVIEEASRALEGLGIRVVQPGPVSLTISLDKALFERLFQTTLESKTTQIIGSKGSDAQASYYIATKPIRVPEELSSLVASIALPTPPQFYP